MAAMDEAWAAMRRLASESAERDEYPAQAQVEEIVSGLLRRSNVEPLPPEETFQFLVGEFYAMLENARTKGL